jgi:ubiquinone/menaquinone biosynthesis C-methylase UbiE
MSKELVQKQFGAHAGAYATSKNHAEGASLKRLVELVQPQADWQVLDVATAAGHTAFAFAPYVAHVTATDITPEMIPVASKLAAEKGITNIILETADAEALPYKDASFKLVTCRIAPHHFPRIDLFVGEAVRVLRPGGILAVVDNVVPDDPAVGEYVNAFEKLRDPSHARELSVAEWLALFEATGLTVLHHEVVPKSMDFTSWVERMAVPAQDIAELRRRLFHAPEKVAEFFQAYESDKGPMFKIDEALILGRKA